MRWWLLVAVLAGCAPGANLRPLTPMGERRLEVGLGATTVSPRPYVDEPWRGASQGWVTGRPTRRLDLSVIGAFDGEAGTAGLSSRFRIVEGDWYAFGAGLAVGSGFIAVEMPFALGLADWLWVYSGPHFGNWGVDPTVRVPLGLDVRVAEPLFFRTEAEWNYADFDPYQQRYHLSFGVAYQP